MAAARYALDYTEPPPALVLAWRCQRWKTLPAAGGLFDQPLRTLTEMETALYTVEAFQERARAIKGDWVKWCEDNARMLKFCTQVDEWLTQT